MTKIQQDKKINKSALMGMFRRAKLLEDQAIAVSTWDGLMELVVLVPDKHYDQYIEMLNECYDDNLCPVDCAPANTPEILDACPFNFISMRRNRHAVASKQNARTS